MDKREIRLNEISNELHEIANTYSGDETGVVAVELHNAAMKVNDAICMLANGLTIM